MRQAPTKVGSYSILRELGRGSFAAVYLALKANETRPVALKLLHKTANDKEILARFDREGELGSRLQHPGIVPVLDSGLDPRGPYLVLEYQEGGSLADRLGRGELSSEEAAEVMVSVARAVHAAHQAGVIHRDLKPANILFDGLGNPRVSDFGLAHDRESLEAMTRTGDVLGTPFYMSPEQISGTGVLDPQTDVYALGVILYECLTGRRPYTTRRLDELVRLVVAGSPAPLGPGISPAVRGVCRRAMSPDRDERFKSAEDMADALELAVLPPAPPPNYVRRALILLLLGGLGVAGAALAVRSLGELASAPVDGPAAAEVEPAWERLKGLCAGNYPLEVVRRELSAASAAAADEDYAGRIRRLLAFTLWRRGDLRAEEAVEEGTSVQRYLRARRLECQGDTIAARTLYRELSLGQSPIARISSVAYRRLSNSWDAAAEAATYLEAGEDGLLRSHVEVERATLALMRRDLRGAKQRLEASLELEPRDVMVLFCLAKWGEASEDRLATLGYLKQALEVCAPREPAYLLTMDARTALDLGDRSRALEDLERAERAEPGYWEVLFLRGRLAAEDQSPHKAEQAFRRASEACPDFDLFLGWVVGLPEEAGVLAVQAAGKIERIPLVRREASLRRRADAVGAKIVYLALDAACRGEPSEAVIRLFEFARRDPDANQAALAWEEALFWVGRDGFEQAPAAIARARELGFDPDRLRLLEGKLASRKSLQAEQYAALEEVATYGRKDGVARSIAFSELAGYAENWEAAQRHVERAREQAPDDPLVWEAYLQATGSEDPKAIEARLAEALPRFGASWLQFLELEAQVDFFAAIQDRDDREGWALATQRLKQRVEGIARISGGVRGLLTGVDMVLLRPSRDRRELAVAWLEEAARRALPHQRHEILLTQGYVELTRPKEELDPERVLDLWRQARAVEPKSKLKGNWYQIFDQRIGAERLAEFGEEFLPDPEDRELKPPK